MATLADLEAALVNADKAGDMDAARKLAFAVKEARAANPAAQIPITGDPAQDNAIRRQVDTEAQALRSARENRTIGDQAKGALEAGAATVTGATGGTLGMLAGTLSGLAEQILSGQFGTKEAADLVEKSATQGAQALTYQPRTPAGQEYTQAVGEVAQNLIPLAPLAGEMAAVSRAAAPARQAAAGAGGATARAAVEGTVRDLAGQRAAAGTGAALDAAARVADLGAKKATTLPRRALEALRSEPETATPGTGASVGSAGTDMALQRRALAESFPVPIRLTKGQASRDAAQLKFEVETAKLPDEGARLRERTVQQNDAILRNMDTWIDQTGAEAPTLRAVGIAVDKALVEQAAKDKAKVRAAYKAAENAGELEAPVTLDGLVQHLNESAPDAATAPLLDVARRRAVQLGIAKDNAGTLEAMPVPLKNAERYRQAISRATDYEATNVRQSTIIKGLVDEATDGLGGSLYRQARATRARYAQNYENRATVSKLLSTKRGTSDRQVAFEDVFDHSILKGSLDDVRNVRRVLQRGGEEGQQAWRELQGQTLSWVRDQATKNVQSNAAGARVVSPAALTKAVRELDIDGRLDFIFGKKGAQQLRDLADLAEYVKTVPPESAINTSNTAATLAGLIDVGLTGLLGGTPAPVTTAMRLAVKNIRDARLRRRITDALDEAERRAPGRRRPIVSDPSNQGEPQQAPARTIH